MAKSSHATIRKVLSVGQFVVAMVLTAWVLVIQTQNIFMNNKDIGYNPRNLFGVWSQSEAMENDFRSHASVEMVTRASVDFFYGDRNALFKNAEDSEGYAVTTLITDPDYIDLMQMKLIAGSRFPAKSDSIIKVILNQSAVNYLEMTPDEVIGKRILLSHSRNVEVCGVVENFVFESLHSPVGGFCISNANTLRELIMIRTKEGNFSEQIKIIEDIYKKHSPNSMFNPIIHEQDVAKRYDGDRRTARIAVVFSLLAIFVACMGVFGLTAFMVEQRTKEIGIRKVIGASIINIVSLFTKTYVRLLLISLVIAIPVAWWVCNRYLQDFANRISLGWWIFITATLITIALTLITVSLQALKAATKNPVDSIKSE